MRLGGIDRLIAVTAAGDAVIVSRGRTHTLSAVALDCQVAS